MQRDVLLAGQDASPPAVTVEKIDPDQSTDGGPSLHSRSLNGRRDIFGLAWVVIAGIAILVPFLIHGSVFGTYDQLIHIGLDQRPHFIPHITQNSDITDSLLPWWNLVWQQVHQGHLPLWDPYGGLGMPLAFNWQSAPLSLGTLVGYLAPLRYDFTVGAVVNILVAGTGAYVLGRVLGMGIVASAAVGTVFELSGSFTAWLGYPFPSVMSWAGWIFAFGLLLIRGRHRSGYIVALAVSVAFCLLGGAPEGVTVLALVVGVFFVALLVLRVPWLGGSGPILRPAVDLVAAGVAGCALAAPIVLPSLQLSSVSVRSLFTTNGALPPHLLLYLAFQSYDGIPVVNNGHVIVFGNSLYYTETAMFVGVTALVLAAMAVVLHRRRPEIRAFSLVGVLSLLLVFFPPVIAVANKLPGFGQVGFLRIVMPLSLVIAVLAGYGVDSVVRAANARDAARWLGVSFGLAAVGLLYLWVFDRGHLIPADASVRAHSFIWPAVETLSGLGAAGFLLWAGRRRRSSSAGSSATTGDGNRSRSIVRWSGTIAGLILLSVETAFLVSAGTEMIQSDPTTFPQTATDTAFKAAVGSATVAFGSAGCQLGYYPNLNDVYGVHELDIYDPIIPKSYFVAWLKDTGTVGGSQIYNLFCPTVTTANEAREFGVGDILEPAGHRGPVGTTFVRNLDNEGLYRISGSGQATVAPLSGGAFPPADVVGTPVKVSHPSPSQWHLETSSNEPQALRLHLTDVPGWNATIDGRPLALESYAGMMFQVKIPAGEHTIVLRYWPKALTIGLVLALASALCLVGLLVVASVRKRRRPVVNQLDMDIPVDPAP